MAAWWGIWQMVSGLGIAALLGRVKVLEGAKARFIGARKNVPISPGKPA